MKYFYHLIIAYGALEIASGQLSTTFSSRQVLLEPNSYTMNNMISQDLTDEINVDNTDISSQFSVKSVIISEFFIIYRAMKVHSTF